VFRNVTDCERLNSTVFRKRICIVFACLDIAVIQKYPASHRARFSRSANTFFILLLSGFDICPVTSGGILSTNQRRIAGSIPSSCIFSR